MRFHFSSKLLFMFNLIWLLGCASQVQTSAPQALGGQPRVASVVIDGPTSEPPPDATPIPQPEPTKLAPRQLAAVVSPYAVYSQPLERLQGYFAALNAGEFELAYAHWLDGAPGADSAETFAAGFADMDSVEAFVQLPIGVNEGSSSFAVAYVPTMLRVMQTDGTVTWFAGCYTVGELPQADSAQGRNWSLLQQDVRGRTSTIMLPVADGNPQHLDDVCASGEPRHFPILLRDSPWNALQAYVDAVNRGDLRLAYAAWDFDGSGVTEAMFSAEMAQVAHLTAIVNLTNADIGVATGHSYWQARTLLIADQHDGTQTSHVGQAISHKLNGMPLTHPSSQWELKQISAPLNSGYPWWQGFTQVPSEALSFELLLNP